MFFWCCARRTSRLRGRHSNHSNRSSPQASNYFSSEVTSVNNSDTSVSSTNEPSATPTSSGNSVITSSSYAAPQSNALTTSDSAEGSSIGDSVITSSSYAAPQSNALTTSDIAGGSSIGDEQSDTLSTVSMQAQAGSPIQMEHSYALTFSSTAEEIPVPNSQIRGLEATPPADAIPHNAIPVSVIQSSPSRLQHQRSGHSRLDDGSTHQELSSTESRSSTVVGYEANDRRTPLPPYMLSSTNPVYPREPTTQHVLTGRAQDVVDIHHVPTEHAQSSGRSDDSVPDSDSSSLVPLGIFDVPLPVPFTHYPLGSGVRTTANTLRAEQTERERQRLEQSTAFIASHSQNRSTSRRHHRRRRRNNNDQMDPELEELSRSSRHEHDRSPNGTRRSPLATHRRRRRTRPQVSSTLPPPPVGIARSISESSPPALGYQIVPRPHALGYQIVPQGLSSSSSSDTLGRPPLPQLLIPPRQISVPVTSTVQLQFQMIPRLGHSSSEPVVELTSPPQSEVPRTLSVSHSSTPFHPSSSQATLSDPMSHSSASIPQGPRIILDSPHQTSHQSQLGEHTVGDYHEEQTVPQSSRSATVGRGRSDLAGRGRGDPSRRQSHIEVIVVDSSDSEVRCML